MANALDMLGRALLRIGGMSPEQIRLQARKARTPKPMPRANTSRPPAPAKPAEPTQVRGQTNLFAQNGKPRDFRKPAQSANRAPTLTPVPTRNGAQATPPNSRPVYGARNPDQLGLFDPKRLPPGRPSGALATQGRGPLGGQRVLPPGRRGGAVERSGQTVDVKATTVTDSPGSSRPPAAPPGRPPVRPSGRFTAPRIPPSQAQIDREVARTTSSSRGRGRYPGGLTGRLSAETVGIPTTPASAVLRLAAANFGTSGESPDVRARILGYRDAAHQRQAIAEAQARQGDRRSSRPPSRFADARQANLDRINKDPKFQAPESRRDNPQPPRSNSGGSSTPPAPPRNRGSGGSYSAAPSRPPATAPSRPPATQAAPSKPATPKDKPPTNGVGPVSDGSLYADKLRISGIDKGGPDLERRRAFLDAKDSQAGAKAVRELLAKRKKRMSE